MRISFYSTLLAIASLSNLFATPQEGLVALWNFESGASNSILGAEALPDGTFVNGASTNSADDPIMENYLELDTHGEYMDIPDDLFFQNLNNDWSAAAWFRAERAPTGGERFFIFETSRNSLASLGSPISLELSGASGGFTRARISTNPVNANPSLTVEIPEMEITDWNHILITYQNGNTENTLTAYLNGISIGSTSFTNGPVNTANGFHIGTDHNATDGWFEGDIDEVSLWNRALTPSEASFFREPIIVTTLADENNNDQNISLREAIRDAPDGAVIGFDPNLFDGQNTITLAGTELLIGRDLTINAANIPGGVTIDANSQSRVMRINPLVDTATVTLTGLTLTGGSAINNGGISPFENLGGGIFIDGSGAGASVQLFLNTCTLSDNSADFLGGGIFNSGLAGGNANLTLTDCTLSNNFARTSGGGIYNDGVNGNASLSLTRCTLFSNISADGGGIYNDGQGGNADLSLNSCTLSGNFTLFSGGGIFSTGNFGGIASLVLSNSILANISTTTGPDIQELGEEATITALANNLLSSLNGQNSLTEGSPGLIIGNPLLSPLGGYGGPTQTILPFPNSPAINAAPESTFAIDQRSFPITDGIPDIGAAEAPNWATPTTDELDSIFVTDFDGDGNVHGQEILLGTDPFTHDPDNLNNFRPILGGRGVTFGRDQNFSYPYLIDVYRSFDLTLENFERVFSYSAFDHTEVANSTNPDLIPDLTNPNLISLPDSTAEEKAFYQLRISNN